MGKQKQWVSLNAMKHYLAPVYNHRENVDHCMSWLFGNNKLTKNKFPN